jgi:hypothetical protein
MTYRDPLHRPLPDSFEAPPEPPAAPPQKVGRSWGATVAALAGVVLTFALLLGAVPHFEEFFSQARPPLSASTRILVRASRSVGSCPVPCMALGLLYPWWTGRRSPSRTGRLARTCAAWVLVASWLWMGWALVDPLLGLAGPLAR